MSETFATDASPRRRQLLRVGALVLPSLVIRAVSATTTRLPPPTSPVVLTITGTISATNTATAAAFGMADLEAIGTTEINTTTPWFDGVQRFAGPLLSTLLQHVGAAGTTIEMTALDDYVVPIPFTDADTYQPIVALRRNGAFMPVREKGPLFLIYPFDQKRDLRTEVFFSRCVWQLNRITIRT